MGGRGQFQGSADRISKTVRLNLWSALKNAGWSCSEVAVAGEFEQVSNATRPSPRLCRFTPLSLEGPLEDYAPVFGVEVYSSIQSFNFHL